MPRCLLAASALCALAALSLPSQAQFFSSRLDEAAASQEELNAQQAALARGQVPMQLARKFPPTALRGQLTITQPPEVTLNGGTARMAPGARIRNQSNLLVMWGAAVGQKLTVNYTVDSYGLLMDIWILRPDEIKARWPKTPEEAAKWVYDPLSETWSKS